MNAGLGSVVGGLSPGVFDLGAVGLLLLFGLWGWWRGAAGQALSLLLLIVALLAAPLLAPRLEGPLSQAVGLEEAELPAAAWALGVIAILLVAGVLVHIFAALRSSPGGGPGGRRWLGGLLGLGKGLILLVLLGYAALYVLPAAQVRDLGAGSRVATRLPSLRDVLRRVGLLPTCTDHVAKTVEERLASTP